MSGHRYDTAPRNLTSLEQRLRNVVADGGLRRRTRRQLAHVAVIAALRTHATDQDGKPLFAVKGGVAVELLLGLRARATKDLDAAVRTTAEDIELHLRNSLAAGWDGFTFRLASWNAIGGTPAHRGDIKLEYKAARSRPCSSRPRQRRVRRDRSSASSTTGSSIRARLA